MATNSPNYDALLEQIQNLSDLQNNGSAHIADPAKQALYIEKLHQQAESIKRVLKLLNPNKEHPLQKQNSQPQLAKQQLQQQLQIQRQLSQQQLQNHIQQRNRASYSNGDSDLKLSDFNQTGDSNRNYRGFTPDRLTPNGDRITGNGDRRTGNGDRMTGSDDFRESIGYEQLWELSTTVCEDEVPEVGEEEDILDPPTSMGTSTHASTSNSFSHMTSSNQMGTSNLFMDDQMDLYENSSVLTASANLNNSQSLEAPPPLPPRLPSRSKLQTSQIDRADTQSELSNRSYTQSELSNRSNSQSELSTRSGVDSLKAAKSSKKLSDFDNFSGGGLNCSTPHPDNLSNRSCLTSTPKEVSEVDPSKRSQLLRKKKDELLSSLQFEEQERQKYYSQLELIAQQLRNIPLSTHQSYSLENEAARQELEERASKVQSNMQRQLGDPEQASRRRRQRVQQVQEIDRQLSDMERAPTDAAAATAARYHPTEERRNGDEGGGARRNGHPQSCNLEQLYHEALPMDRALSHSGPPAFGGLGEDTASVMSFTNSVHSVTDRGGGPVEIADSSSIISLLGCSDMEKMSRTLLAMSSSPANCDMLRGSRCIPLLVQLLHLDPTQPNLPRPSRQVRARAARCLHNIVHAHPTDKHCKREAKVLKLLEVLRQYCDLLRDILAGVEGRGGGNIRSTAQTAGCRRVNIQVVEGGEKYQEQDLMVVDFGNLGEGYPAPCKQVYACQHFLDFGGEARQAGQVINIEESMAVLTRCSFDESHRQPIFLLGGIPALAELIQVEHGLHPPGHAVCREVRRYAVVALTNLTFGNTGIKSYLCQFPGLVEILVGQLDSQWENLRKATAHLFRNLAWKADKSSKSILSESRVVGVLMSCAMSVAQRCQLEMAEGIAIEPGREEPTLKVILSALWNLSAHCKKNKSEVCSTPGALQLLVQFLRSRSTAVVENGGGILRNISSYIATSPQGEDYRRQLREEGCLSLLLAQLRSPSLTIVSNSCGTLWNFSARNSDDQELLWELGAVPMLQALTNSKHKTISTCSLAALRNLYIAKPAGMYMMVSGTKLMARKVKNMEADLGEKLSDCSGRDVEEGHDSRGNTDDSASETEEAERTQLTSLPVHRSESRTSVSSVPSVTSHYSWERNSLSPDRSSADRKEEKSAFVPIPGPFQNMPRSGYATDSSRHSDKHSGYTSGDKHSGYTSGDKHSGYTSGDKHSGYTSDSPPPLPKRGEGNGFKGGLSAEGSGLKLSAEGRFDGNYKSFMKQQYGDPREKGQQQQHRHGSPARDNYVDNENERVMSPSSLAQQKVLSPGSIPLDLTKKKPDYADEVELCEDKPTDYSLRFQESEEPELLTSKAGDKAPQLFDDFVKTYCTEGTPLDTPYLCSTATSISDLREPPIQEEDEDQEEDEEEKEGDSTTQYAVEGTPITFTREGSLSSLESGEVEGSGDGSKLTAIPELGEEKGMQETGGSSEKEDGGCTPPPAKDQKTVTFLGGANSNANQTPLMYSRASSIASLGSLDSCDQQSIIPSGYTSCDYSRAASSRVSPSDLPDSPSQTMPRPKSRSKTNPIDTGHFDEMRTFHEEGTPAVFSTRTSLSGLNFEDEEEETELTARVKEVEMTSRVKEAWPEQDIKEESEDEEEDIYADSESILNQIINSGMPSGRAAASKQSKIPQKRSNPIPPNLNESGGGSDDSCCSAESTDILQACIASAMPSKGGSGSKILEPGFRSLAAPGLGPRQAGEGAPADPSLKSRKLTPMVKSPKHLLGGPGRGAVVRGAEVRAGGRGAPPPPERRGSHLSHPCVAAAALSMDLDKEPDRWDSGDAVLSYGVEDTPINFSTATSLSDLTVDDPFMSGRISRDSHDGLLENRPFRRGIIPRSRLTSGGEGDNPNLYACEGDTPHQYATEDTPAVMSRGDSLSSLEFEQENSHKGPVQSRTSKAGSEGTDSPWGGASAFPSHLPRPLTVGRSASSGSSTGAPSKDDLPVKQAEKSFNSSLSSLSVESLDNEDEDLLALCISSAMPKSKSEHFDLAGKGKRNRKSPRREKARSVEKDRSRTSSKSPRNSRIIPGVVIPELKLRPRTPSKSRPQSGEIPFVVTADLLEKTANDQPKVSKEDNEKNAEENAGKTEENRRNNFNMEDEPDVLHQSTLPARDVTSVPSETKVPTAEPKRPVANFDFSTRAGVKNPPLMSPDSEEMSMTLTQSRVSDLEGLTSSRLAFEAGAVAAGFSQSQDLLSMTGSQYSEGGETLSMVQPPSIMMESLPSLTQHPPHPQPTSRRPSDVKLECRHTLSGKLGSSVPLAVRRALGGSGSMTQLGSVSQEDLSSLSSCQSNLDNIRPPTIMDDLDMENSMLSVASLSSEFAAALAGSGGSDDVSASLTSEAILDIVRPAGAAVEAFSPEKSVLGFSHSAVSCGLESVEPPTCLEDLTLVNNSATLVPGHTFVVEEADTCADVTDVFDEESVVEPTLTTGSDAVDGEVPELPRDSRHTTPAQSGGESSVESTPLPVRKLSPKQKRQLDPGRYLTFTKKGDSPTASPRPGSSDASSGYKSQEIQNPTSRQHRLLDEDRFKTRTISKEDLTADSPQGSPRHDSERSPRQDGGGSPKTLKQRRAEEAERFRTQTIVPADILLSPQDLASEARLVVATITAQKAEARSRSTSADVLEDNRSRSASVDILREHEMQSIDADVGSIASRENLLDIPDDRPEDDTTAPALPKPRICKPWESRVAAEETPGKSIGGRRRVLYSPPMKRATVPPAVPPKPSQTKARVTSSPVTSPKLVRPTRAMALRQANAIAKKEGRTSPNLSPRSINTSGSSIGSPRSVSSGGSPKSRSLASGRNSRTQSPISADSSSTKPAPLVRQGTFTKDDSPKAKGSGIPRQASNVRQSSSISLRGGTVASTSRTPPKVPPKPTIFRRDTVQPSPNKPIVATTKTQQLREKSLTRGGLRSSNSSTSSVTSKASTTSRTSIRTSSSSHSLRAAAEGLPKRTPSSSEIERRRANPSRPLSPVTKKLPVNRPISPNPRLSTPPESPAKKTAPKKDVTSKIASLWKKVEDSKKQKKDATKDKRVWISKGKVQDSTPAAAAPAPGRLIRSGTYEKINDPNTTTTSVDSAAAPEFKEPKVRSRSRLSMKLSKFSLKRGKGSVEDQVNGNTPVSPDDELGNNSVSSISPTEERLISPTEDLPHESRGSESSESMSTGPDSSDRTTRITYHAAEKLKNAQIKRNSSYVSSMGRKQEEDKKQQQQVEQKQFTSSSVVTLV